MVHAHQPALYQTLNQTLVTSAVGPMVPNPAPAPCLPFPLPSPAAALVTPYDLAAALLFVLQSAGTKGHFTSLTNPVWDGWASWRQLAWRLPASLAASHYSEPEDEMMPECYWQVATLLSEMADERLLEKRLHHPLAHSTDVKAQGYQEWKYRLPGYGGYCHWEPARQLMPEEAETLDELFLLARVTQDNWRQKLAPADIRPLVRVFDGGQLPPFILAQIERRWIAKLTRPKGQGRRGCPKLR